MTYKKDNCTEFWPVDVFQFISDLVKPFFLYKNKSNNNNNNNNNNDSNNNNNNNNNVAQICAATYSKQLGYPTKLHIMRKLH